LLITIIENVVKQILVQIYIYIYIYIVIFHKTNIVIYFKIKKLKINEGRTRGMRRRLKNINEWAKLRSSSSTSTCLISYAVSLDWSSPIFGKQNQSEPFISLISDKYADIWLDHSIFLCYFFTIAKAYVFLFIVFCVNFDALHSSF